MTAGTEARKPFKEWFDKDAAAALADQLGQAMPSLDRARFVRQATRSLADLEFNDRVRQFASAMAEALPDAMPEALAIVGRSLPPPLPDCESVTDGWLQWPVGQFIADYAVDDPEPALNLMVELTQRFSAEFAVRPFVERYPQMVFARLRALTDHPSPHVRRWCSEGVRPRLPWGRRLAALIADPTPIWPIVDKLKDDPELYVRRSVANNLNDIAKDHPDAVVAHAQKWLKGASPERAWVVKHKPAGPRQSQASGRPRRARLSCAAGDRGGADGQAQADGDRRRSDPHPRA